MPAPNLMPKMGQPDKDGCISHRGGFSSVREGGARCLSLPFPGGHTAAERLWQRESQSAWGIGVSAGKASSEFRIQAAMQRRRLWHHEALAYIEQVDRERRQWVQFLFNVDWEDPRLYDIVLNLNRMRLATAVETIAHLTERDEFKPTAESLKAMQDLALATHVSAVLASDTRTKGHALRVVAADGIVTITGTTHWPEAKKVVQSLVRRAEGVKEVRGEILRKSIQHLPACGAIARPPCGTFGSACPDFRSFHEK